MKIWIQGKTLLEQFLQKRCGEKGYILSAPSDCDIAVLEYPYSNISEELAGQFDGHQKIIAGIMNKETDRFIAEKNWSIYRPLKDEIYLSENAQMTAEGAVWAIMEKVPFALKDARCLVIGYGRIGKALTVLLRSFGSEVIVAARRAESRQEAGENSISISRIPSVIRKTDLILNTVPNCVLLENSLFSIKNTAFLFELASKPYGFDMEQAKRLGVHASLESGLPGRYCPQSAADALLRFIERSVQIE